MGFHPPKGVRPPQLEGKRSGRPRGSRNFAGAWADVRWGYDHRHEDYDYPPNPNAMLWWFLAHHHPGEVRDFLARYGRL